MYVKGDTRAEQARRQAADGLVAAPFDGSADARLAAWATAFTTHIGESPQSMPEPALGTPAPLFSLPAGDGTQVDLGALRGQRVVLYFYPKDATPGCTRESQDFRDLYPQFQALTAQVLGISRDSVASHARFAAAQALPFPLLSDPDEAACRAYDVIREKNLYGRKSLGVERSTFLIDEAGVLRAHWRKVKVPGHAQAVLETLAALP